MALAAVDQRRLFGRTDVLGDRTVGAEAAAAGRADGRRHVTGEHHPAAGPFHAWVGDGHYLGVDITIEKFINAQFSEH